MYHLTALITVLALLLYFAMSLRVGKARSTYGIPAPAMTGHPAFERYVRIQANTLESMPMFLPLLWLFAVYIGDRWAALVGLVWIIGRILYMTGYAADAKKRGTGFMVQFVALLVLTLGTLYGIGKGLM